MSKGLRSVAYYMIAARRHLSNLHYQKYIGSSISYYIVFPFTYPVIVDTTYLALHFLCIT